MNWLNRPSILILLSVGLAVGATVLVLWDRPAVAVVAPLGDKDQEIVWLYSATNAANWERFVTAVNTAAQQLKTDFPDLEVQVTEKTFPQQTTTVPELALTVRAQSARLVFRWYKLTSDQKTDFWIEKLSAGPRRPPLAIIGGSSSHSAIELAQSLADAATRHPKAAAPLLIFTTATADRTQPREAEGPVLAGNKEGALLNGIYQGRTYRFCFTNQQMAQAVTHFIWSQDNLRPDTDPIYMVEWEDDAYSRDLIGRFSDALRQPPVTVASNEWASAVVGALGDPLRLTGLCCASWTRETRFSPQWIDCSIGAFDQPNRWEAPAVDRLMGEKFQNHPAQKRPLLVLSAAAQGPARRFLRGMMRESPTQARRFVVATGDGLAFNTIYRDRNIAWPIQDLPYDLVFFCHRNPVDADAGFRPQRSARPSEPGQGVFSTGTEDLLLYVDIVKTLVHAAHQGARLPQTGDELRQRLSQARWHKGSVGFDVEGQPLFDADGHRRPGTGEHVVWLQPHIEGEQIHPNATIRVWSWPARTREPDTTLEVEYDLRVRRN